MHARVSPDPGRPGLELPASLRARIGQMMLLGFRGLTAAEAEPTLRQIRDGSLGAVILYDLDTETGDRRNIQSPEQLKTLVSALKAAADPVPLLVAVDGEGGYYHRLKEAYGFPPATPAQDLGERGDLAATRAAGDAIAAPIAEAGIDVNFAPVVDLLYPANLTVAARRRSFSPDPAVVAAHARAWIEAHHDRGVLTVLKHFPGMGSVTAPYRIGRGERTETWVPAEIEPYRALLAAGVVDAILATRVSIPQLDADFPATLSKKIIDGLLRGELGFDGVVISDAMEMLAIWDAYGFERGTILAVNAGVDILLYCNMSSEVRYDGERSLRAIEIIEDAVRRGEIAEARIDEACARVLRLKERIRRG